MRGAAGPDAALESLQTLYSVLLTTVVYMVRLPLSSWLLSLIRCDDPVFEKRPCDHSA